MRHGVPLRNDYHTLMRSCLPYGKYICADGVEVMFNRDYQPMWRIHPDGTHSPADPHEWITAERSEWFYTDKNPPSVSKKTKDMLYRLLLEHLHERKARG